MFHPRALQLMQHGVIDIREAFDKSTYVMTKVQKQRIKGTFDYPKRPIKSTGSQTVHLQKMTSTSEPVLPF